MIKSIAIEKTDKAFLPEAYAYRDYFREHGYVCNFIEKNSPNILEYDAVLLFHGFHPFWKKYPKFVISEYHSLSTGKFHRTKDVIKRLVNVKADLYIFLNEDVRKNMFFSSKINYITRSMGFFEKLVSKSHISTPKKFDIVYCGSDRPGVAYEIEKLASLGFIVAVVGFKYKSDNTNIKSFGKVKPIDAMNLITQSKYGLNFTPVSFPLNIQDSTKVIEYCAAGLGVITNKYKWVDDFELSTGAKFLDTSDIQSRKDIIDFDFIIPDISYLSWSCILKSCGIINKLKELDRN